MTIVFGMEMTNQTIKEQQQLSVLQVYLTKHHCYLICERILLFQNKKN